MVRLYSDLVLLDERRRDVVVAMTNDKDAIDVAVIGAGLAGMAAAVHLADAGLKVVCIEADLADTDPVGESLDWSAPALLKDLGLPMDYLLEQGIATYKRHVVFKLKDGSEQHYIPGEWLGKPPFNIDLRTLHVDRTLLNRALREIVLARGVTLVRDKVVHVETSGRRVDAIVTANRERIASPWFLDASGSATSLFPRVFGSTSHEYGPHKVAMWDYFSVVESVEGTTLYADGAGSQYMEWIWQIPIHPDAISVGYVCPGESVKQKRQRGMSVRDIFQDQLERFPDLRGVATGGIANAPRATSFRCRVFNRITGPNWLVIGEAAAMVDPMTSNGVTAAMRHAAEASRIIARSRKRSSLPYLSTAMYTRRVIGLAGFFNSAIEKILYESSIRNRIGAFRAGDVYTIPAWSINVVYSRLQPNGVFTTLLFGSLLGILRAGVHVFYSLCNRLQPSSESRPKRWRATVKL
jgi:flavin-dependent dehydrogenase